MITNAMSSFPQIVLCIATAGKSGFPMRAWLQCLIILVTPVTGYTGLANLSHLSPTETVFVPRVHNWLIATWCLSIATQFGATLMIGYRFWKPIGWNSTRTRNGPGIRKSRLDVLWILVECGALYSVTTIFLLGFSSTNTGTIFAASLGQISVRCLFSLFPFLVDRFVLLLKGGVGDAEWDFYGLGIGPDSDHRTGGAERLASVLDACEGIHRRLGLTAGPRPV
jgi:hypothetical protein